MEIPDRPDLKITVGDRVIKMTYGLEMDLRRMLPDPTSALTLVQSDPTTQDYLVRRVLTDQKGLITDLDQLIPSAEVDISSDDVEAILSWVLEHVLYFFVKRATETGKIGQKYLVALPKPTPDGSGNSASTTPSAGPSES